MATGMALGRFNDRGFTFIQPDGGADRVFLHISGMDADQDSIRVLQGTRLEFDLVDFERNGTNRQQARRVRVISSPDPVAEATLTASGKQGTIKFWNPAGYGFVTDETSDEEYYVHAENVPSGYLRYGDACRYDLAPTGRGGRIQAVNVRVIGWEATGDPFPDLIDMRQPSWTTDLARLAEEEPWNYPTAPARDEHIILRSYLKHTFLRVNELPNHIRLSQREDFMAFNTGLVTPYQEQILAVFRLRGPASSAPHGSSTRSRRPPACRSSNGSAATCPRWPGTTTALTSWCSTLAYP